jgi:CRP/FNR family transcriptional regulator
MTGSPTVIPFDHLLSEAQKELLYKNLNTVRYKAKDIVFRQNVRTSHVMFVNSGLLKVYKEGKNDRSVILKVAGQGTYIGLISVFGDKIHKYSAAALKDSEVSDIDITVFRSILLENGKFALHFLNLISLDGLFIFERLMSIAHQQLPGRIAGVLRYFSVEVFKSEEFELPLTRRELADFAGTVKESFIRTLTEFKNDKIIELNGNNVKIISMDIIKTLSELG